MTIKKFRYLWISPLDPKKQVQEGEATIGEDGRIRYNTGLMSRSPEAMEGDRRFAIQRLLPLAERGEKFLPVGRGQSVVTKWIEKALKKTPEASAAELWERICEKPPRGLTAFSDRHGFPVELEGCMDGRTVVKRSSWDVMVSRVRKRNRK